MTPKAAPAQDVVDKIGLMMVCGACGAALPNEGCGHKANGVPDCCLPSVDMTEAVAAVQALLDAARAEGYEHGKRAGLGYDDLP